MYKGNLTTLEEEEVEDRATSLGVGRTVPITKLTVMAQMTVC